MSFPKITLVNKTRYYNELPQIVINKVNYTFDSRLKELRVTERPWENIKLTAQQVILLTFSILEQEERIIGNVQS